ncbi:MAG: metalloregulator ArsR/SmtB family transcription factor [Bacteroidota bacterium]
MHINQQELDISAQILRAIAHPLRMRILSFIDRNECINVNKIYTSLGLEQSITSQHLRILRNAGLVRTERDGKFVKYSIDYSKMKHAGSAIREFLSIERSKQNAA